jgi:hypothetical protein
MVAIDEGIVGEAIGEIFGRLEDCVATFNVIRDHLKRKDQRRPHMSALLNFHTVRPRETIAQALDACILRATRAKNN